MKLLIILIISRVVVCYFVLIIILIVLNLKREEIQILHAKSLRIYVEFRRRCHVLLPHSIDHVTFDSFYLSSHNFMLGKYDVPHTLKSVNIIADVIVRVIF